jgi:hypothetical protein
MLELPYIAGFFDGEGYITVSHWKNAHKSYRAMSPEYVRYQLHVGIGNTHKPLIDAIQAQCGGNVYAGDSAYRKNPKNRICYNWRLSSRKAMHFLQNIAPYLVAKRDEALLAIELQHHVDNYKGVVRYYPEEAKGIYAHRQVLTDQIRALKKRRFDIPVGDDPVITIASGP